MTMFHKIKYEILGARPRAKVNLLRRPEMQYKMSNILGWALFICGLHKPKVNSS